MSKSWATYSTADHVYIGPSDACTSENAADLVRWIEIEIRCNCYSGLGNARIYEVFILLDLPLGLVRPTLGIDWTVNLLRSATKVLYCDLVYWLGGIGN